MSLNNKLYVWTYNKHYESKYISWLNTDTINLSSVIFGHYTFWDGNGKCKQICLVICRQRRLTHELNDMFVMS